MGSVLSPVVVGRAAEMGVLRAGLDGAGAGRGSTVLVLGEPGVGKSRLLRETRRMATERGMAVLMGRAVDTTAPVPFRPVAEALLGACRVERVGEDPDVVPYRAALGWLVPQWAVAGSTRSDVSLLHIAEGFLRVARSRGRAGGAVVVFDDLHWADRESLAVVEYLADNVADESLLVVAAARNDPGLPARGFFKGLADRRVASSLEVPRLGVEHAVAMTRQCLGDARVPAEVLQLVIDRADGLPFFVEELLATLENDRGLLRQSDRWVAERPAPRVPATFAESVRRRFSDLTEAARELLLDAALLGRRIDLDMLAMAAGGEPGAVMAELRVAEQRLLLEWDESGLRFRHALTRDALLADLPHRDRVARAGMVLARLQAGCPDRMCRTPEVVADLAEVAQRYDDAAAALLEVGRQAIRQGALTSAESAQRRALVLAKGTELELEATEALVETLGLAGRTDDTFPSGEILLARFEASPDTLDPTGTRRHRMHVALGRAAVAGTDWALAAAHLDAAARYGRSSQPAVELTALQAVVALGEGRLRDAGRLAADAVAAAEHDGDADLVCEALLVHGRCLRIRDHDAAERAFDRARTVARDAGLAHREARALAELGSVHAYRGGTDRLVEARQLAEACGVPETEAVVHNHLAVAAWFRGDVEAILDHAAAMLQLARRYHLGLLVPAALIHQACGHALRGDRMAVEELLARAEPQIAEDATQRISMYAHVRGVCALANDDLAAAGQEFAAAASVVRGERPTAVPPLAAMAVLLAALDGTDPQAVAAEIRGRTWAGGLLEGVLAAADAVTCATRGDPVAAAAMMYSALVRLEPNTFVHAVVVRLVAPHAVTHGWGEPTRWLDSAVATFDTRGLVLPAGACRAVLRRASPKGERGPDGISARERDVLALIAEGLANRAIAQRLFISSRTVEKHVERLLAKTGSVNRSQLVSYALNHQTVRVVDT